MNHDKAGVMLYGSMPENVFQVLLLVPIFLISLCVHEYAHARVALWRGDETALRAGRLTLNPAAHADMVGTIFLPIFCLYYGLFFIGWAKPVPVDANNMKHGLKDMALVAVAGPLSNLLLAFFATLVLGACLRVPVFPYHEIVRVVAFTSIQINLMLAVFNLLPIPPLDGFRIIQAFLPRAALTRLWAVESYLGIGFLILIYVVPGGLSFLATPVNYLFDSMVQLVLPSGFTIG